MISATGNIRAIAAAVFGALASMSAAASENGPLPERAALVTDANDTASTSIPAPYPESAASTTEPAQPEHKWGGQVAVALSEERLDAMRGGFDLPNGLKVSFGLSRVAFVNGNMVATTTLNIPDVSQMTAQQAQALATANMGSLIQVGSGNAVQAGALPPLAGSVIQNTLNNQHIQALTTIDTSVNTLSLFKSMNLMSTINDALTSAVRGK
jgi:hypothetical protein